ncbi:MFS transporter, partial [Leptolyngbya sp. FACHB-36]|nr:MFS transporter [Leptolyngbya sp. FACHB-36]
MEKPTSSSASTALRFSAQVWMQAIARSLYQVGYGLMQFYVPIVFVNQMGLSAASVGLATGLGSLSGVVGHFLGGALADDPRVGRKKTLLFSAGLSMLAAIVLALVQGLPLLVLANLLMGISLGFYWTAADAAVMDATDSADRHQAFAILGLAESLGVGVGVLGGGVLLAWVAEARSLFLLVSLIFLVFLVLVQTMMQGAIDSGADAETPAADPPQQGWRVALNDRRLRTFVLANVLFTTYIAVVNTTLPLYLTNFAAIGAFSGSSTASVATLFTGCYVGIGAIAQVPIVQVLGSFPRVHVLMMSMLLWGGGFFLVWAISVHSMSTIAALGVLSIATAVYKPFAAAIVAELAPPTLRGSYIALSSQCWAIGY